MRSFAPLYLFSALVLASAVFAQRLTTTDDDSGETLVVSTGTDIDGDPTTRTISTITTRIRTTATTAKTTTTTDDDDEPTTSITERIQTATSFKPMKTTTYWYDPGNGVWTSAAWTASVTAEPTVATYNVPEGTMVAYTDYQSFINNLVTATVTSGEGKPVSVPWTGIAGWTAMVAGALGAGAIVGGL